MKIRVFIPINYISKKFKRTLYSYIKDNENMSIVVLFL